VSEDYFKHVVFVHLLSEPRDADFSQRLDGFVVVVTIINAQVPCIVERYYTVFVAKEARAGSSQL